PHFDAPIGGKEQVVSDAGKGGKLARERIAEVGHVFQKIEATENFFQRFDQRKIKETHHSTMQAVGVADIKSFCELISQVDDRVEQPEQETAIVRDDVGIVKGQHGNFALPERVAEGSPNGASFSARAQRHGEINSLQD